MSKTTTAPVLEQEPIHGLNKPVIISMDTDLIEQFSMILKSLKTEINRSCQSFFNIRQRKGNIILTAHFHDSERSYRLELEAERRTGKYQ